MLRARGVYSTNPWDIQVNRYLLAPYFRRSGWTAETGWQKTARPGRTGRFVYAYMKIPSINMRLRCPGVAGSFVPG